MATYLATLVGLRPMCEGDLEDERQSNAIGSASADGGRHPPLTTVLDCSSKHAGARPCVKCAGGLVNHGNAIHLLLCKYCIA